MTRLLFSDLSSGSLSLPVTSGAPKVLHSRMAVLVLAAREIEAGRSAEAYLGLHAGVPADVVADPQLEVAHAGHGIQDVVGVAHVQGVREVFQLAVDVRPKRDCPFWKALQGKGVEEALFPIQIPAFIYKVQQCIHMPVINTELVVVL